MIEYTKFKGLLKENIKICNFVVIGNQKRQKNSTSSVLSVQCEPLQKHEPNGVVQ